jgi:hypothetical protein
MEVMRFAFYKPPVDDTFGHLIAWWTGVFNPNTPAYSHVEIGFLIDGTWKYYSSASRNKNGKDGTRWIDEKTLFIHPERWDVYTVTPIRETWAMIKTCDEELDKRYDWFGIFGFVTLFGQINKRSQWYCSEICRYVFFGKWRKRVSPRRLFSEIAGFIVS